MQTRDWLGDPAPIVRDTIRLAVDAPVVIGQSTLWVLGAFALLGALVAAIEVWELGLTWRHRLAKRWRKWVIGPYYVDPRD